MKKVFAFIFSLLFFTSTYATHNRAGEITYEQIGALTYRITITTYTKADAPADRCELEIDWGDDSFSILNRINGPAGGNGCEHMGVIVNNNIKKNIYVGIHTFPANGTYTLKMLDPNRNDGVLNIPNSVNEPFYIQTIIKIGIGLGVNSSPILLNPPTDFGCVNTPYIHNLAAYDADGDSISYKMVNCRGAQGREINTTYTEEYNLDKVYVDTEGSIRWDAPIFAGIYNIAVEISEHRYDPIAQQWITIGRILRDIQIDVLPCVNNAPEIITPDDYCVIAGEVLDFDVTATDEDGDDITLTAVGGPFIIEPSAVFDDKIVQPSPLSGNFRWETDCTLARNEPYQVTFKANDHPEDADGDKIPGLSTQQIVNIKVLASPVENLSVTEDVNNAVIDLNWEAADCNNSTGYVIYRKEHSGELNLNFCEGGVPEGSGFKPVGIINNINNSNFIDTNNEQPFKIGVVYCYTVTTILFDGSESLPAEPVCITPKKRLPALTNVDIEETSYSSGEISVIWSKPTEIDTEQYPGPYSYKLLRSQGINSNSFIEIADFETINDTLYYDTNLNTYENAYRYRVDLYNNTGNTEKIGESYPASSPYLNIVKGDSRLFLQVQQNVPWRVDSVIYYQEIGETLTFEEIGRNSGEGLLVENLENGTEYCFKAHVYGSYSANGYVKPLINKSQIGCETPEIVNLNCPPELTGERNCLLGTYLLTWNNPNLSCDEEITSYNIYYTNTPGGDYMLADTVEGEDNTSYEVVANGLGPGCFYVTAVDLVGNETLASNRVCYAPCTGFELPNVFTPNNDGINDIYHPKTDDPEFEYDFDFDLRSFDIEIFNRWGDRVYKTDDIRINWDGTNQITNGACAEGVYYYVCIIILNDESDEAITLKLNGYIHLLR